MILDPAYVNKEVQNGATDTIDRPRHSTICRYHGVGRGCNKEEAKCHFAHIQYPSSIKARMIDYSEWDKQNRRMDRQADRNSRQADRISRRHEAQQRSGTETGQTELNNFPRTDYNRAPATADIRRRDLGLPSGTVVRDDGNINITQVGAEVRAQQAAEQQQTAQATGQHQPPLPPPAAPPPMQPSPTQDYGAQQRNNQARTANQPPTYPPPAYPATALPPPAVPPTMQQQGTPEWTWSLEEEKYTRHPSWAAHDAATRQLQQQQQQKQQQQPTGYYPPLPSTGASNTAGSAQQQATWEGRPDQAWKYQPSLTAAEQRQHADEISRREPSLWGALTEQTRNRR